jgi:hypothetical protein
MKYLQIMRIVVVIGYYIAMAQRLWGISNHDNSGGRRATVSCRKSSTSYVSREIVARLTL